MSRHSIRSTEGYLLLDHRASPGLPADFFQQIYGIAGPNLRGGGTFEAPTLTCCHCGIPSLMNPLRTRPRNYCPKCDQYVCDQPGCNVECTPHAKTLDDAEKRARLRLITASHLEDNYNG